MIAQLPDLGLDGLQILKGFRPLSNIPQQRCRMVDGGHLTAAPGKPLAMLAGDFEVLLDDGLGSDAAQAHDDLGSDEGCLSTKKVDAGILLHVLRVTILRRTALYHVGDIDFGSVQTNDLQHIIQQLAGAPYKVDALLILV